MGLDEIDEFLRKKGAVEVLVEIGTGSATYQNINDAVLASSSTVSNRLQEAVENELIEVTHRPTDYGTQKRYALTDSGKRIFDWALDIDLEKKIRELRRVQRDRDNKMDQLLDYVNRDQTLLKAYSDPNSVTKQELERLSEQDYDVVRKEEPRESREQRRHEKLHGDLIGEREDDENSSSGQNGEDS
jgi:DNA-binding HxlR family transcriptional regulator